MEIESLTPGEEPRYPCSECRRIYKKFGTGKVLQAKLARTGEVKEVGRVCRLDSPIPNMERFVVDFGTPFAKGPEFYLHPECAEELELA